MPSESSRRAALVFIVEARSCATLRFRGRPMRRPLLCAAVLLGAALAVGSARAVQPGVAFAGPLDGYPPAPVAREVESVSPDGIEVAGWNAGAVHVPSDPSAWGGERPSMGGARGDGQPLSQRVA